jgi:hypothetical protein
MDGRCQEAVGAWCRHNLGVDYPDTITIAGANGILLNDEVEWERALKMAGVSVEKHGAAQAVVVGHAQCAGFVADETGHKEAVRHAVAKVAETGMFEIVVGLYHDIEADLLEEVCRARGHAVATLRSVEA